MSRMNGRRNPASVSDNSTNNSIADLAYTKKRTIRKTATQGRINVGDQERRTQEGQERKALTSSSLLSLRQAATVCNIRGIMGCMNAFCSLSHSPRRCTAVLKAATRTYPTEI
tara:strand:- start:34 stop:372 length:339 start_codon:yes stop_codon:yes gene_type:complete